MGDITHVNMKRMISVVALQDSSITFYGYLEVSLAVDAAVCKFLLECCPSMTSVNGCRKEGSSRFTEKDAAGNGVPSHPVNLV